MTLMDLQILVKCGETQVTKQEDLHRKSLLPYRHIITLIIIKKSLKCLSSQFFWLLLKAVI